MTQAGTIEAPQKAVAPPNGLLDRLDEKLHQHLAVIERSELYQLIASEQTRKELVVAVVRNVLLEVYSYGKHIVEATFTAIGRMPLEGAALMRSATTHILDEVTHPHLALRDFVALGGNEAWARQRPMSPPAFAMAATCRVLAERSDPFSYLGFMYLFESLTPVLAQHAQRFLAARLAPQNGQKFIDLHAVEDIKHVEWMRDLINRVVRQYPRSEEAIEYGFDCFRAVYPLPLWQAALQSAKLEVNR